MIITCPHCHTKYQVADQAIGAAGRKVHCACCHQSWEAVAPVAENQPPKPRIVGGIDMPERTSGAIAAVSDRVFDADSEDVLDKAFADEEARIGQDTDELADPDFDEDGSKDEPDQDGDSLDTHLITRRKRDLVRRQKQHASHLPLARFRRYVRLAGLVALLTLLGLAYQFRVDIVRAYPDLGGLYQTVGLPVNIYGLTFTNAETLRTLKDGADVTIITAKIRSVVDRTVRVPPVLVSILNAAGEPIYEWTARAPVDNISPGDVVGFETQLTSAPEEAAQVRLVFSNSTTGEQTGV